MNNKNKTVLIFGMVAIAVGLYFINVQVVRPYRIEKQLKAVVADINKRCPCISDEYSMLDSSKLASSQKVVYYKKLYSVPRHRINFDSVKMFIVPYLTEKIKKDLNYPLFKRGKIIIDQHFYDAEGNFINNIQIKPDMYLQ